MIQPAAAWAVAAVLAWLPRCAEGLAHEMSQRHGQSAPPAAVPLAAGSGPVRAAPALRHMRHRAAPASRRRACPLAQRSRGAGLTHERTIRYARHRRGQQVAANCSARTRGKLLRRRAQQRCAAVRHPVSRQLLAEFAHEAEPTVQAVLDEWQLFLQAQQVEGALRYSVYHSSLRAFLVRQDVMQAAGVSLWAIHAQIAEILWRGLYGEL